MTGTSRRRRVLVGILVIPLLTAIGLEAGCRLLDRWRGKPWDAESSRLEIERVATMLTRISYEPGKTHDPAEVVRLSRSSILSPYTGWEERLTQEKLARDTAYYRTEEAKAACDILVLGGSVAYFFGEQAGPRLIELIRDAPRFRGREFEIHNYALGGYKQPQPALTLAVLLAHGHEPDVVLLVDGFNESAIGWANGRTGMHPAYPSTHHWTSAANGMAAQPEMVERLFAVRATQDRAREFAESFLRSGAWRSCFLDHVGSVLLERRRRAYVSAFQDLTKGIEESFRGGPMAGPAFDASDEGIAGAIVTAWAQGSITMRGLCDARSIPYLHVLQPTLHDEGSKPLTEREIAGGAADPNWIEGVRKVYPRLREAGEKLAARGIDYLDASRVFAGETNDLYYDTCHFGQAGNVILAQPVAEALLRACAR
ncbi:MAG: hypothetical protein ACKVXR_01500 [Planctomycetota bacterium]